MKIKTSELQGPALNGVVARIEFNGEYRPITVPDYSADWSQGGPIIEREHIDIRYTFTEGGYRTSDSVDAVHAAINLPNAETCFDPKKVVWEYGPTPLISAMRCFVASKLGDYVEVPDELLSQTHRKQIQEGAKSNSVNHYFTGLASGDDDSEEEKDLPAPLRIKE